MAAVDHALNCVVGRSGPFVDCRWQAGWPPTAGRAPAQGIQGEQKMASHDAAKTLTGKVALVTGAGRGLGRAFAERLAALGAAVAIHGMRENGPAEYGEGTTLTAVAQEVGREHGVRTVRVLGDLTRSEDIERVVAETEKALGPIDI